MHSTDLLADAFGRIAAAVHAAVDDLTPDELAYRIDGKANSIAWLVWHLTRIQDDHVAGVAGAEQSWTADGWADRFGLPFSFSDTGYGHTRDEVAAVRPHSATLLTDYHDAVLTGTIGYLESLTDGDLSRIVDRSWDPPVTLGVRLVSVISDDLEHAGQAAFVRGVVRRKRADR